MNQETCSNCGIETSDTNDLMPSSVVFDDKLLCIKCYASKLDGGDAYYKATIKADQITQIVSLLEEVLKELKAISKQSENKAGQSIKSYEDLCGRSQHCTLCTNETWLLNLVWIDNQNLACRECYSKLMARSVINWKSKTQQCSFCKQETINEKLVWSDRNSIACLKCYDERNHQPDNK